LDAPPPSPGLLSLRKLIVNLVGFAIGLGLFVWIVVRAVRHGDWSRLLDADPWLVAALLGSTALSVLFNGTMFWITIQPLRPLTFADMQRLNVVASLLNYAPLRLGAIARVLYHLRVDRLALLEIGAWFALTGYILVLGIGSCVVASLARERVDLVWAGLVGGQVLLGGMLTRAMVAHPLIVKYGRGLHHMIGDRRALWGCTLLRLADIGAFVGRMAAALAILDIHMGTSDTVMLALVALSASLIPFGRLGFREFCVTIAAARLAPGASAIPWEQLALVESAGEALVCVPAGAAALFWFRRRWIGARRNPGESATPA
jgi:hypothetical protein